MPHTHHQRDTLERVHPLPYRFLAVYKTTYVRNYCPTRTHVHAQITCERTSNSPFTLHHHAITIVILFAPSPECTAACVVRSGGLLLVLLVRVLCCLCLRVCLLYRQLVRKMRNCFIVIMPGGANKLPILYTRICTGCTIGFVQ